MNTNDAIETLKSFMKNAKKLEDYLRPLERKIKRLEKNIKTIRKENKQLRRDNEDMHDSLCARFDRCDKCDRLHDAQFICFHCGWDSSANEYGRLPDA